RSKLKNETRKSLALRCSLRRWGRNRDRVGFRPDSSAARQIKTVHGDLQAALIDIRHQVVVIHSLTLERIVPGALNRIGVRSGAAGHEVGDAAVLVAFIVMDVSGKD